MTNQAIAQIEASLIAYLTGYLGNDPARREQMQNFPDWQRLARLELEMRDARFLTVLPDEELSAIARGEVDLALLAGKIPG
jgi:hypothetical protein